MRFLEGIGEIRKGELLKQLRIMWTHDSTAIEGNTLTLGDTMFVLGKLTEADVFRLHRLVINEHPADIYKPVDAYRGTCRAYARTHVGFTSIDLVAEVREEK